MNKENELAVLFFASLRDQRLSQGWASKLSFDLSP